MGAIFLVKNFTSKNENISVDYWANAQNVTMTFSGEQELVNILFNFDKTGRNLLLNLLSFIDYLSLDSVKKLMKII